MSFVKMGSMTLKTIDFKFRVLLIGRFDSHFKVTNLSGVGFKCFFAERSFLLVLYFRKGKRQ